MGSVRWFPRARESFHTVVSPFHSPVGMVTYVYHADCVNVYASLCHAVIFYLFALS